MASATHDCSSQMARGLGKDMRKVQLLGFEFYYFGRKDGFPRQEQFDLPIFEHHYAIRDFMSGELERATNFRVTVSHPEHLPFAEFRKTLIYYLYWTREINLDELDRKVENDSSSLDDFSSAVFTEYSRIICFVCKWEGRGLRPARVPIIDCLPDSMSLYEAHEHRVLRSYTYPRCPKCNSPLLSQT